MNPPSVGGPGGAFSAPAPGTAATPSAPAAPSAFAPPADVAKPTPARPAVAGGVAPGAALGVPPGTQDPAAAAAMHAARQFFGFMQQGMAAGGFGVPPGAFGAPPDARQGAPMMPQHVDPSDQPPRGATPGVAADLSHCNTPASVTGVTGVGNAEEALKGADVVVIPAGS